jgi:hypothetical protein
VTNPFVAAAEPGTATLWRTARASSPSPSAGGHVLW